MPPSLLCVSVSPYTRPHLPLPSARSIKDKPKASLWDQVSGMARFAMDRSNPTVEAAHQAAWNLSLFVLSAYVIQKYGYRLAL